MLKIRRSRDRLIFNMGISIPGKDGLYIETGPLCLCLQMVTLRMKVSLLVVVGSLGGLTCEASRMILPRLCGPKLSNMLSVGCGGIYQTPDSSKNIEFGDHRNVQLWPVLLPKLTHQVCIYICIYMYIYICICIKMSSAKHNSHFVNSLWPSNAIWRHRPESTLS